MEPYNNRIVSLGSDQQDKPIYAFGRRIPLKLAKRIMQHSWLEATITGGYKLTQKAGFVYLKVRDGRKRS